MQKRIHEILNELGIPASLSGREVLSSAIELVYKNGKMGMTTELYPILANAFGLNSAKVERRIRYAIERCFDSTNTEVFKKFFGNTISFESGKLVNSEFIYGIVEHLKIYG